MHIEAETLWFGLFCAAVLVFTGFNRSASSRAFVFAWMLFAIYATTNLLNYLLPYPEALGLYPLVDATAGGLVAISFWRKPRVWNTLLCMSFLLMSYLHVQFWIGQVQGQGYAAVSPYIDNLDDIFKIQLALVCIPGGINVGRRVYDFCAHHRGSVLRRIGIGRRVGNREKQT